MSSRSRLVRWMSVAALAVGGAAVSGVWGADEQIKVTPQPVPSADQPPKSSAKVSDDARQLLDQMSGAYGKLKSLHLEGTVASEAQVGEDTPEKHSTSFTSSFVAPNRFKTEVKDDLTAGSTGQKLYVFKASQNAYTTADAPKDRVAGKELPRALGQLLQVQNPSLYLAMMKDPSAELLDGVTEATRDDQKLGDTSYPTLKLVQEDKTQVTMALDPQTHLLREVRVDLTPALKKRRPDLGKAVITVDYTTSTADGDVKDEFAWAPPPGATDAAAMAAAHASDPVAASALEGKAAPDFELKGLDGKPVRLADLKGHVTILDFWATWCGPCKMSLPHLDELYKDLKDKGLTVYALDQQEEKADVNDFVHATKLAVPVLLDSDGKVGEQYGVQGIPQTVVIGKDGKVQKVFVGFNPDESPRELKQVVEKAMAQ